jgi:hypothetical protein
MSVDVLGQSGIGNQGYYDTSYHARSGARGSRSHQRRLANPQAFEKLGHHDLDEPDEGRAGVADDIPPQAQTAVDDGVFLA